MGLTGPAGPSAVYIDTTQSGIANLGTSATQVASLNLPAGSYFLSAKVVLEFGATGTQQSCTLNSGSTPLDLSFASAGAMFETVKLLGAVSFPNGNNVVTVTCQTSNGTAVAVNPVLTALQVGAVTSM